MDQETGVDNRAPLLLKKKRRDKLTQESPHLAAEWINAKNDRSIDSISGGSHYKAWWQCSKCENQWKASVTNRRHGTGCPKCSGRHGTSLVKKSPHLAKEWMVNRNGRVLETITTGSGYKAWWKCSKCTHQWQATVNSRNQGRGCRPCGNASKTKQPYIIDAYKNLVQEWVSEKNDRLLEKITAGSQHKVWWECGTCSHQWKTTVASRTVGSGCPKCAGRHGISVVEHFPHLTSEWMLEKNGRNIQTITAGSVYKAWWKCIKCENQWKAKVEKRTKGSGCPKCSAGQISFSF